MRLRHKLLWLISALLLLPWLSFLYLQEVQQFLLRGQESAQQLTAQSVATLLQTRADLLKVADEPTDQPALYAWPTDLHMQLDGYADDWHERIQAQHIGPVTGSDGQRQFGYSLRLAQRQEQLFLLLDVDDSQRIYRHPGLSDLSRSDQLRLALRFQDRTHHFLIAAEGSGRVPVLAVDQRWRYQRGELAFPILAAWQERQGGYRLELSLPVTAFAEDSRLWLAMVDSVGLSTKQDEVQLPIGSPQGRPVRLHSPELQQMIAGLRESGRHIWVLDRSGIVRAVSNLREATPDLLQRSADSVRRVMAGNSVVQYDGENGQGHILVAEPIRDLQGNQIGSVLVEVATGALFDLQRSALIKYGLLIAAVLLMVVVALLLFSAHLTWRIRRLAAATRDSLDPYGRVRHPGFPEALAGRDELSALGDDVSALLARLYHHGRYLEQMPRTLRHEVSNPLNTISTSLEMLREPSLPRSAVRYLDSADRGVQRLSELLETLTEAASLEEALLREPQRLLDLTVLAEQYVHQHRDQCHDHHLVFNTEVTSAPVLGIAERLEQVLDKLFDNAEAFAPAGSELTLSLSDSGERWLLSLVNQGPPLAPAIADTMFESLVSQRPATLSGPQPEALHLGIGLYVVRLIAEAHGGGVAAANTQNGVCVSLFLPKASAAQHH